MRINKEYTLHKVAEEHIIMLKNKSNSQMTKVAAFNPTATWLWNKLIDSDFCEADVVSLLTSEFDIDNNTATQDAQKWIKILIDNDLVI